MFASLVAMGAVASDFSDLPGSADVHPVEPDGKLHPVHARLIPDRLTVAPGETLRLGVHLEQADGWHTYWKSPGGIGQPTEARWTMPAGWSAGSLAFPVPLRFETDGLVSYGYDHEVMLVSSVTVPADAAPGPVTVEAAVNWLVCQATCRPGEATLRLPLQVGPTSSPSPWVDRFDEVGRQVPVTSLEGWRFEVVPGASAVVAGGSFRVGVVATPPAGVDVPLTPTWPTVAPLVASYDLEVSAHNLVKLDDGSLFVAVEGVAYEPDPLPEGQVFGALWQVPGPNGPVAVETVAPIRWAAPGTVTEASTHLAWKAVGGGDGPPVTGGGDVAAVVAPAAAGGLLLNLLWAFVGGLLLNVMPCVLPVLTLKLYGLVEQGETPATEQRRAGIAYSSGILVSFWALAAAVIGLRLASGVDVSWGFQFQYPPYVAGLASVVFLFGLSLFGVFEIPALGGNTAADATNRDGPVGYFFTGVFATLLATPCSAPFLGTAIAFAFTSPTFDLFAIFSSIAFGLAAPFLLVAFVPAAYRLLPRPGAWMEAFKQLLGFSLIATTVWLVDVLMAQVGTERTTGFLAFLTVLAIGAWIFGRWGGVASTGLEQLRALAIAALVSTAGGYAFLDLAYADEPECDGAVAADVAWDAEMIPWQPFSDEAVTSLAGKPVFIDFTADWCLTCKVNERVILETAPIRDALKAGGFVPLKGDWTRKDEDITTWLHRYGRAGVPFYLILPADRTREAIALPEVITTDIVLDGLARAK